MNYHDLQDVIAGLRYKPGWSFSLLSGASMSMGAIKVTGMEASAASFSTARLILLPPVTLVITLDTPDSGNPERNILVPHHFIVPDEAMILGAVTMNWDRWVLDRIHNVETHEMCEVFEVNGRRPFYPAHGPDADLYAIRQVIHELA